MSIDHIIDESIKISQPDNGFRFGTDSVILSWFATVKKHDRIIDIGSGSGVIATLLAKLKGASDITAVELQPESFAHLQETVALNKLEGVITPVCSAIQDYIPTKNFTLAVCNPPYRPVGIGKVNEEAEERVARFEETLTIDEILAFCKKYLNYGGRLAFCGDADRLIPAINACCANQFQPKRLRFLHSGNNGKARLFFMECVYGGGVELSIEPNVIMDDIINDKWL
jgi:tRNA1Val (adenine37-N6)-methyltransferase